ncbi:MAG: hypothetical protein HC769_35320 [Cyanobacteria bacterium CRU_2_1]|nr:hypothetical protein [Cyanobacteria bacterium CRU_2_1]
MLSIYELICETLEAGWLSLKTEQQIRELFDSDAVLYKRDFQIIVELQRAVDNGDVKREAIEIHRVSQAIKNQMLGDKRSGTSASEA